MSIPKIEVQPTLEQVAEAGAEHVIQHARRVLEEKDTFSLCLAGGGTPKAMYERLARPEYARRIEWSRLEIYVGDERCVPPDHPESNFGMAKKTLLNHVPVPGDNIYRMKGEIDPQEAAKEYGQLLKEKFGESGGFDLLLLGMGEDGHTLSLFPGTEALDETKHRCVANFVPKLNDGRGAWRLTITAPFANRSAHVLALVTGEQKAAAVQKVLEDEGDPKEDPIRMIDPGEGRYTLLLDAAAAGMHEVEDED